MWPESSGARAWARSISAEMHSGFAALRSDMTMCIRERIDVRPWSPALAADIDRVTRIFEESRRRFGSGGAFLCGRYSIADCFFAPVAFRFQTYGVKPEGAAGAYVESLLAPPRRTGMGTRRTGRDGDRRSRRAAPPVSRQARPRLTFVEHTAIARLEERIRGAVADRRPLRIRGAGTKDFYGDALTGDSLDVRDVAGIVSYEPGELVLTALGGTPLAEIEDALAAHGQMLAFEPPHHGGGRHARRRRRQRFLGAAASAHGCRARLRARLALIDGTGTSLVFGGQVIKNVAGFDVSRLMTGALGTLGVLTRISLKCLPRPKVETTRVVECDGRTRVAARQRMGRQAAADFRHVLPCEQASCRLSGAPRRSRPPRRPSAATRSDGADFWRALRDQALDYFRPAIDGNATLWRLSVRSTAPWREWPATR